MASRLIRDCPIPGYLVGDGEYHTSRLFAEVAGQGGQLVAPRRKGKALGHRRQRPERLRGLALEDSAFGQALLRQRSCIERFFGTWHCWGGGSC